MYSNLGINEVFIMDLSFLSKFSKSTKLDSQIELTPVGDASAVFQSNVSFETHALADNLNFSSELSQPQLIDASTSFTSASEPLEFTQDDIAFSDEVTKSEGLEPLSENQLSVDDVETYSSEDSVTTFATSEIEEDDSEDISDDEPLLDYLGDEITDDYGKPSAPEYAQEDIEQEEPKEAKRKRARKSRNEDDGRHLLRDADDCRYFGYDEETVSKFHFVMMAVWTFLLNTLYIITVGGLIVAPITFMIKKFNKVVNRRWLSVLLSCLVYLVIVGALILTICLVGKK